MRKTDEPRMKGLIDSSSEAFCKCRKTEYSLSFHWRSNSPYVRCPVCMTGPRFIVQEIENPPRRGRVIVHPEKRDREDALRPPLTRFASEVAGVIVDALNKWRQNDPLLEPDDPHAGSFSGMSPPDMSHEGPWLYIERGADILQLSLIPITDSRCDGRDDDDALDPEGTKETAG